MGKSQIDGPLLGISVLASIVGFSLWPGPNAHWASVGGLALALILLSYDREGQRTVFQSFAFAGALALALMLAAEAAFVKFDTLVGRQVLWAGLALVILAIDRARMSGRLPPEAALAPASPRPGLRAYGLSAPAHQPPAPHEPVVESVEPPPPPAPVVATHPMPPVEPAPVASLPAPVVDPNGPGSIPSGREALIYVSLVGEGMNVLRGVRAEHLRSDYYRIADDMPPGETWQYVPGQVVRCKKRNLSSGKAMVAYEEAQRAR